MIELDVEQVVDINKAACAATSENHAVLDRDGVEAAVARPFATFDAHDLFEGVYSKAAALLHGLASRQAFENGNKRTAWLAMTAFLEVNGVVLGRVNTVQADMFVRAAGLDHSLEIARSTSSRAARHAGRHHSP